jgi:hypothetical protein
MRWTRLRDERVHELDRALLERALGLQLQRGARRAGRRERQPVAEQQHSTTISSRSSAPISAKERICTVLSSSDRHRTLTPPSQPGSVLWTPTERNKEEGMPMMRQTEEAQQQHLLLLVESAQRAGLSEAEIGEIADAAVEADAKLELDRAA